MDCPLEETAPKGDALITLYKTDPEAVVATFAPTYGAERARVYATAMAAVFDDRGPRVKDVADALREHFPPSASALDAFAQIDPSASAVDFVPVLMSTRRERPYDEKSSRLLTDIIGALGYMLLRKSRSERTRASVGSSSST